MSRYFGSVTSLKLWLRLNVDESDGSVEKSNGSYIYRGSYMNEHVIFNLLSELRKRDKMRELMSILSLFCNEFYNYINTKAQILESFYNHVTLRLLWRLISGVKKLRFCHYLRNVVMDVVS